MKSNNVNTLVDHLITCADEKADAVIYTFLNEGLEIDVSYGRLHENAVQAAGCLQSRYSHGDRVILALKPGADFVISFFGCLYAGLIPIPLYPPVSKPFIHKIGHVVKDASPSCVISSKDLVAWAGQVGWRPRGFDLVDVDEFGPQWASGWVKPDISSDDIAFLQYTSGSTNHPKGVMVTHGNIMDNNRMIKSAFSHDSQTTGVCWLPVYHDMGLIGNVLHACYSGSRNVMISPLDFITDPLIWLELITKYKATISGGPNFAYDLCVRRYDPKRCEKLDLSSWDTAYSGAEPVRADTLDRFSQKFREHGFLRKFFLPCYGLAENTLMVSSTSKSHMPNILEVDKESLKKGVANVFPDTTDSSQRLVGSGTCPSGQVIRIVDPEGFGVCEERRIGEIWLKGPSAAKGYWNNDELTRKMFRAYTSTGEGPFVRTGDLGFIEKGELFVTGRIKDLIIIRGKNYYPQDIEYTVEHASSGIRPGRVTAFLRDDDLCIAAEYGGPIEEADVVMASILKHVKKDHELKVVHVRLVEPKSLPVTTSGKIRRNSARERFESERLDVIARYDAGEEKPAATIHSKQPSSNLTTVLSEALLRILDLEPGEIDPDQPFGNYGMSSFEAVEFSKEISRISGQTFTPTMLYDYPTINRLTGFLENGPERITGERDSTSKIVEPYAGDIAIVGMACRFPGSPDLDAYWDTIEQSRNCVRDFPEDARGLFLRKARGNVTRRGGFMDDIDAFDAGFFNVSKKEATLMDPQHRIFLETVWHCLEHAGYAPGSLSGQNVGVFVGVTSFDYSDVIRESGAIPEAYTITGMAHTMIANRISYLMNLHGPSEAIDTACSSSLVAVHRAVSALRQGGCSMALAGGVNVLISPDHFTSLGRAGFLSEKGQCRTFDHNADGYVRGEGCGVIMLKPLKEAEKDGDFIHAVIRGVAVSHGGKGESLTAPSASSQARLIVKALDDAGVTPDTIGYIETHGTGTVLGDPIEVFGLVTAFREMYALENKRFDRRSCALGAVKSNIGHLESAAGIAGIIKVAEVLKRQTLPPSTHIEEVNPLIQLDGTPFYIPREKAIWPRAADTLGHELPRRAGISSFGFGGTYAHVILEDYESRPQPCESSPNLFVFSAKSKESLEAQVHGFLTWLEVSGNTRMVNGHFYDAACTLAKGRDHWQSRFVVVASSVDELFHGLKQFPETMASNAESEQPETLRRLKEAGQRWVQGDDLDHALYDKPYMTIPMPGYIFEKTRYFAFTPQKTDSDGVDSTAARSNVFTHEDISAFLVRELKQVVDSDDVILDIHTPFDSYGLDSMALISLLNSLEEYTGLTIDPAAIQDYVTIDRMAGFIAGGMVHDRVEPDLAGDTELDDFLFIPDTPHVKRWGQRVFLTGCTGYLGSYLLVELLEKTGADIYCLVRAGDEEQGRKRVEDAVVQYGAAESLPHDRVHIIIGDLATWKFGLDRKTFSRLSSTIDTIWHCGATVDWMKSYEGLKQTNVEGTRSIIHLASRQTIKHLYFVSSLAVLPFADGQNEWFEQEVTDPRGLVTGYGQSKWVSEQLCLKSGERGIPVSVFRFDYVAGKPGSGVMKQTDFIARMIKGCIQMGSMPLEETNFDIIPVDYLCRMMVAISKAENPQGKIYHLINRRPFSTSDFASIIRKRGYKVQRLPYATWKTLTKKDPKNALYPLYPFINRYDTRSFEIFTSWRVDNTNAMTALYRADASLIRNIPDAGEVIESVMDYLTKSGFLTKGVFGRMFECHKNYWKTQFEGAGVYTPLPEKSHVAGLAGQDMETETITIDPKHLEILEDMAREQGLDLQVMVLTLVFVLLSRYSRQNDLVMAVFDRNKRYDESPDFIRCRCSSDKILGSLVFETAHVMDQAWVHRDLSRDVLESLLGLDQDGCPYPIGFDWNPNWDDSARQRNRSALTFECVKEQKTLRVRLVYDRALYGSTMITQMAGHLAQLILEAETGWDSPVSQLSMLDQDQRDEILYRINQTETDYPHHMTVPRLFSDMARRQPHATALIFEGETMSYGELNTLSDRVAVYLHDRGIGRGHVVGLCVERSMTMMTTILGILKSGAAYLPLDPDYPPERLAHMINDAGVQVIICNQSLTPLLPIFDGDMIVLENHMAAIRNMPFMTNYGLCLEKLKTATHPDDLAYIIYTSGSTGKPKGVRALHKGIVNLVHGMARWTGFTREDTMLGLTRLSFDMVKPELYLPLTMGGTLHIITREMARDGFLLKRFLEQNPITVMQATPSSWRLLLYAGWEGNQDLTMITGGEALPEDLAQLLVTKGKTLLNLYGPTETTVWSTGATLDGNHGVHIGYPLANTRLYVLDPDMNPVPKGVPGELYIGGHGVTQGYHMRPDLTRERYLPDPFLDGDETIYRTGDLVRMRFDGALEYMERLDHQVKVRGYRIELKEIERALADLPEIKEAVVLAGDDASGQKGLIAWVVPEVPDAFPETSAVHQSLKETLPPWMIPSSLIWLDRMPLNTNGKIDRKALMQTRGKAVPNETRTRTEPFTETERIILSMWIDALGIPGLGVTDDFTEFGGDSLKAMRVLMDIRERFKVDLTVQKLFENLTVRALAKTIERMQRGEGDTGSEMVRMMLEDALNDIAVENPGSLEEYDETLGAVFLTGATGYLGAYILRDLMERTECNVYCLVRSKNHSDGFSRIQSNLETFRIWDDRYESRIIALSGDLAEPMMGLDSETYHSLASHVDAVIHNGAMVNFSYSYPMLRKANVNGTREAITFSFTERIKPLYYVSTIGVFESRAPRKNTVQDHTPLPGAGELYYGYAQSKWVAEKLVSAYRDKGMPVTIYRPGPIYGDSTHGSLNTDDFFCRMIKACVQVGGVPDVDVDLDGMPVDQVSRVIVETVLRPETLGQTMNIVHPSPVPLSKAIEYLRIVGYDLTLVPADTWINRVKDEAGKDAELVPFLPLVSDSMPGTGGKTFFDMQTRDRQSYGCETLVTQLEQAGMTLSSLDADTVNKYLGYLKSMGYLPIVAEYQEN